MDQTVTPGKSTTNRPGRRSRKLGEDPPMIENIVELAHACLQTSSAGGPYEAGWGDESFLLGSDEYEINEENP